MPSLLLAMASNLIAKLATPRCHLDVPQSIELFIFAGKSILVPHRNTKRTCQADGIELMQLHEERILHI